MEAALAIRFNYLRAEQHVSSQDSNSFGFTIRHAQSIALAAAVALSLLPASAQYPGQVKKDDKNAPVLRSVAVLEFTGDPAHPKASRLIPVSVYDGQQLQDGGIYLARPQPLALDGGVEYQLQLDGRAVGYFDIQGAGQAQGSWVGQGILKPLVAPRTASQIARAQRQRIKIDADDDAESDGPVLHRKSHDDDDSANGGPSGPPPDPDRPTLHKAPSADSGDGNTTTANGGSGPTLHRAPSADSGGGNSTADSGSGPAPDPDRPTLHKAPSADSGSTTASADPNRPRLNRKPDADEGSVSSLPNISDPDRPRLIRGKPAGDDLTVAPTVIGLPPDLNQEVAVSDARTTPDHPWNYTWANLDDEAKMKASLEDQARKALGLNPPPAPAAPAPTKKTASRSTTHKAATPAPPPPPPTPAPLLDEQFRVFELAYGSGATMVLTAHTDGAGAQEKFVTLIAQPDLYGSVVVLLKSVTDAAHLDDTPRMRLVDAVDAMGDNRGELLFELRGQTQRQFALYRVLRGSAEKLFVTGGQYIGNPTGE